MKNLNDFIKNVSFEKKNNNEYPALSRIYLNPISTYDSSSLLARRNDKLSYSNNLGSNFNQTSPRNSTSNTNLNFVNVGANTQKYNNITYLEINTYSFDKQKLTIILTHGNESNASVIIYQTKDKISYERNNIDHVVNLLMQWQNKDKNNSEIPFYWHHDFNEVISGKIFNNKLIFT